VIDKLAEQAAVLADKSQPKEKRAEALKWVVHLAGDIHQPLHCADRHGDKGGNKRLVFFLDRKAAVNLHSVWDTWIIREMVGKQKIAVFADSLDKKITPKQRTEWAGGTPEQWANQTHRVAVEKIYRVIPEEGPPPKLGRDYVAGGTAVVIEQLQRAGTRLARIHNVALVTAQRR
jgi:nuclease S1